ncbi:MAG TPA: hypothetical protein VD978_09820 [Azospirillum sp.]|nr:hypothetical protein [Azospirillum sp.]
MAHSRRDTATCGIAMVAALAVSGANGETGATSSVSVSSTVTQTTGGGSSVSVSSVNVGGSAQGVDIRVVNGTVWINGEKVPEDATHWRTRNGVALRIRREGGQVHVTTE